MKDKVYEKIKNSNEPLSFNEISDSLELSKVSTHKSLEQLIEEQKIKKITIGSRSYYIALDEGMTVAEFEKSKTIIMEKLAYSKGNYEELEDKIQGIDSKVDGFYINIISIMGVFVAIFSLLTNNAKIAYDFSQSSLSIKDICIGIAVSNGILIFSIGVLLILIKILIGMRK